jgi:ABC-type multidrug transport system fused ATPase/permease subunit
MERIQAYIEIEQEPKPVKEKVPPAAWPTSGKLRVENLYAHYSSDGPKVLHDLSFTVESGERVGIVGCTGSGKSSLTLSLLRCIFTDGKVYYDGIETVSISLDVLRSNITIIPQVVRASLFYYYHSSPCRSILTAPIATTARNAQRYAPREPRSLQGAQRRET